MRERKAIHRELNCKCESKEVGKKGEKDWFLSWLRSAFEIDRWAVNIQNQGQELKRRQPSDWRVIVIEAACFLAKVTGCAGAEAKVEKESKYKGASFYINTCLDWIFSLHKQYAGPSRILLADQIHGVLSKWENRKQEKDTSRVIILCWNYQSVPSCWTSQLCDWQLIPVDEMQPMLVITK